MIPVKSKKTATSKQIAGIQRLGTLALLAILVFATPWALAQSSAAPAGTNLVETNPVQSHPQTTGPISHNYKLKKIDGTLNILVNPDGTWNFSGSSPKNLKGKDFDVTLALKSSTGAVILFHYVGDASNGIQFSKQGKNQILKDNFASFASSHQSTWEYRIYESAAGRRQLYEQQERKKAQLRREEEEARKRHQEQVAAQKKAELRAEEQAELAWEQKQQRQQQQSQAAASKSGGGGGGGGSSVGSVVGAIASGGLSSILSFL